MKRAIGDRLSAFGSGWKIGCAAALLLAAACWQPGDERQVKNAVGSFYDVYMKVRPSGVPPREQQAEFKKFISTGLAGLLDAAASMEENSSREAQGPPPPRIEGDLFTSSDEGAVSYKIVQCEMQKPAATCVVELTNADDRNRAKLAWKDRVFLVQDGGRWVVDDIEFLGDQQFMHRGRLKDVLKQVIEEGKTV
ncbi:MAG TPA: hypothetical protein VGA73_12145 [Candidatus Binatia bacterium]